MKPGFRKLGVASSLIALMLLALGACNREQVKQPPAEPAPVSTNPVKPVGAEQAKIAEPKRQPPPQAVAPQPQPVVGDAAIQKSPNKSAAQPVELGRSSVTQAEEPAVRTPDLHGWDPLGADCAWFREFKRDV